MNAEEQGFEVVDKRRVNADGSPRETTAEETGAETEAKTDAGAEASEPAPEASGVGAEPSGSAQETSGVGAEPSGSAQETRGADGRSAPSGPPIGAREVVAFCIGQLHEIAWSRMGLVPNPVSGTIERDLTDARLAIDCAADLVARLDPVVDPALKRELQNMLSDLRLNFVQQSQRGGS